MVQGLILMYTSPHKSQGLRGRHFGWGHGSVPPGRITSQGELFTNLGGGKTIPKDKALLPGVAPTNRNISPTPGSRPGAWTPNERISIRIV